MLVFGYVPFKPWQFLTATTLINIELVQILMRVDESFGLHDNISNQLSCNSCSCMPGALELRKPPHISFNYSSLHYTEVS